MVSKKKLSICDGVFKNLYNQSHVTHVKCHKGRTHPSYFYGKRLNYFLKKDHTLDIKTKYQACHGMRKRINATIFPRKHCR